MTGERPVISGRQMMYLLIAMRLEIATIILPTVSSVDNPQDSWVSALVATAAAIPVGMLVVALAHRFPGLSVVQFSRRLCGRAAGAALAAVYLLFFLHIVAAVAGEVALAYNAAAMPETPWLLFAATVVALGAIAAACGLEVLGRAAEVACAATLLLFAAILLLPFEQMRLANLMPVLASGVRPALLNSLIALGLFASLPGC